MQLLCKSDSRAGGISDVFAQLQAKCENLGAGSFRILERHIQDMDEKCHNIKIGNKVFRGEDIQQMIVDTYEEGFVLAESVIRMIEDVTKVYIFGRPPASNKLIGHLCKKRFCDLRDKMKEEGCLVNFDVEILASDIASYVALSRQGRTKD